LIGPAPELFDVCLEDASARASARHVAEVQAVLFGDASRERRGFDAFAGSAVRLRGRRCGGLGRG
jgi:hypothetical protein